MSSPPASTDASIPVYDPRALLERISDAYIVLDHAYRFVYANRAAERDMQKTLEELRGRVHWDVFPASYDIAAGRHYRLAKETRTPQHFTQHYAFEGYDIHMEMDAYPTDDDGVAVFWRDVTARVKAEQALRLQMAWFRSLFEQVPFGIAVLRGTDLESLHFEIANTPFRDMVAPGQALVGQRAVDVMPIDDATRARVVRTLTTGEAVVRHDVPRLFERDGVTEERFFHTTQHPLRDADGVIAGIVLVVHDVTDTVRARHRAESMAIELGASEARARDSEERYALAARATSNVIWSWELATGTLAWNEGLTRIFGYAQAAEHDQADWWLATIHPDDQARVSASIQQAIGDPERGTEWQVSYRFRRADGGWAEVLDRGYIARDAEGVAVRLVGAMEDVTAQHELEARLRQAQKMEAIGQLAGGIAHDFNNLLTVIGGNVEFARDALPVPHAARADLEEIAAATDRARTLVRQLLTFSRKQPVQPQLVQVGDVVSGTERLLRRVIGEEIAFEVHVEEATPPVLIDPGQLEQVLMNLVVNARDAMLTPRHGTVGTGGSLTVEVTTCVLSADPRSRWRQLPSGRYVQLAVRDSGHGMDEETRAHLFEPFFTTKDVGSGTGLGLATVHGIVTQAGGAIHVDSAPGHGSTFTILLPTADGDGAASHHVTGPHAAHVPPATILVVEDEAPVRAIVRRTLERHGHRVLEARHGRDALQLWRRHAGEIDALLTDVRMPEMGGRDLALRLRRERALLPVVYLSGYAEEGSADFAGPQDRFVEKPFTADALIAALAALLHAR